MNYNQLQRLTVVGGFTTGRKVLERMAQAACEEFGFKDAAIFTLPESFKRKGQEGLAAAAAEGSAVLHSYGAAAIRPHMRIPNLLVCNGVEQHLDELTLAPKALTLPALARAALTKRNNNAAIARDTQHRLRMQYGEINRDHFVQGMRHPAFHIGQLLRGKVQSFSTSGILRERVESSDSIAHVGVAVTTDDEFWPHHVKRDYTGIDVYRHYGNHDRLLADPIPILTDWVEKTQ